MVINVFPVGGGHVAAARTCATQHMRVADCPQPREQCTDRTPNNAHTKQRTTPRLCRSSTSKPPPAQASRCLPSRRPLRSTAPPWSLPARGNHQRVSTRAWPAWVTCAASMTLCCLWTLCAHLVACPCLPMNGASTLSTRAPKSALGAPLGPLPGWLGSGPRQSSRRARPRWRATTLTSTWLVRWRIAQCGCADMCLCVGGGACVCIILCGPCFLGGD